MEQSTPTSTGAQATETTAALRPPRSLSPSSMSSFTSCALAYRFAYIQRLPEPPSAPASKGTLVHLALQHLHADPPELRTLERALAHLDQARAELANDPDFTGLQLTDDEWSGFHAAAATLVEKYFDLEDPKAVRSIGLELKLEAEIDGVKLRGIIDRLDLGPDGELIVIDYKTGAAPKERWVQKSLAGVHVYSLLCETAFGKRPARVQLLYLATPQAIVATPTDGSTRAVRSKSVAIMQAVQTACERRDFRPSKSALCSYCSFQEFCPVFGGDPEQAAPVLLGRATTAPHAALPLAATRH